MARPELTDVAGIGAATAEALRKGGIFDVASLAAAPLAKIVAVHGFGPARAQVVKKAAAEALAKPTAKDAKKKKDGKGKDKKGKGKKGKGKKGKDKKGKGKKKKKKK